MTGVATDALSIGVTDPTAQLVSKDLACQVTLSKR
jgi:hypothetical protein